jgi:GT2 family glycosyltransferase
VSPHDTDRTTQFTPAIRAEGSRNDLQRNGLVRNRNAHGEAGDSWCIQRSSRASAIWVKAATDGPLRWLRTPGRSGVWESVDERACFALDRQALGAPLEAGWYELRGRCEVQGGKSLLPSVRLRYAGGSALTDLEILLPELDAAGRVRRLFLFLDRVESLQFYPGIRPVRFRMRGFCLRRVSRLDALRTMLGGTAGAMSAGGIRRLIEWARMVRRRGMKRATDELYAGYQRRMGRRHVGEYAAWICKYDTPGDTEIEAFKQRARLLGAEGKPSISLLLRVCDSQERRLRCCLDSVLAQVWEHWELCVIANGSLSPFVMETVAEYANRDPRIRLVPPAPDRNALDVWTGALAEARGEFLALIDQNGALRPHSLLRVAECLAAEPGLGIVYSDEDRLDADGVRRDPDFKPDWNPDLLRSRNYAGDLTVFRTSLVHEAGGLRVGFEEDWGHDLILRCSELVLPRQIRHLPEILYHEWASVDDAPTNATSGARAVIEHLQRIGSAAEVRASDLPPGLFHVRWPLPQPAPRVSVIIPTRDRVDMLRRCVESVLALSTYPDFELVVVDNGSTDRGALEYLQTLAGHECVRLLRYDAPFNFSAINNWAARQCTGQLLALVNNDVEVIACDWLEEMAGFAVRADVGAVGAMLYYPDNTIQHAGMLLGIGGIAGHVYAGKPRGYRGYQGRALVAQNLSAVTGACLMVRRELFEAIGGFDERLPVEFNDVDFCLRLDRQGYRNVWTPFAKLYHHESASRVLEDASATRMREDGIVCMMRRWQGLLLDDPAYNPNLSLQDLDFGLAFPPRVKRVAVHPDQ